MKKTSLAIALISAFLFSALATSNFVRLGAANPWYEDRWTDPPVISTHSPTNKTYSDTILLNFTVTKPEKWKSIPTVYLSTPTRYGEVQQSDSLKIEVDEKLYRLIEVHSNLSSPFSYSESLTNLTDGTHSLRIYAFATGVVEGCEWKPNTSVAINSSSEIVHFTVVGESSSPSPTPTVTPPEGTPYYIPITFVIGPVIAVAVGVICLFIYFKKRSRKPGGKT
jgi:hypothetical protein